MNALPPDERIVAALILALGAMLLGFAWNNLLP